MKLRRVKMTGLSTYVPPRVLTNDDLEKLVDTSNEWILQRTGIRERHIVDPGVATSDRATEAALGAMRQAGDTPDDIGFIVVGTTTPDTIFPSTACMLQDKIGARRAWGCVLRGRVLRVGGGRRGAVVEAFAPRRAPHVRARPPPDPRRGGSPRRSGGA